MSAALTLGNGAAALCFANAYKPGGGYRRGSIAQEEDLCTLLPQLISSLEYMQYPMRDRAGECFVTRGLQAVRLVGTFGLCPSQGSVNIITAAMPTRVRREFRGSAPPCLPRACKLCEASFPASDDLQKHVRCAHGG